MRRRISGLRKYSRLSVPPYTNFAGTCGVVLKSASWTGPKSGSPGFVSVLAATLLSTMRHIYLSSSVRDSNVSSSCKKKAL